MLEDLEKQLQQIITEHKEKIISIGVLASRHHVQWNITLNNPRKEILRFHSLIKILDFFEDYQSKGKITAMPTNKPSIPERTTTPYWRKRAKKLLKKMNRYFMCIFGSLFIGYVSVAFCLQNSDTTTWTVDQRTGYLILCTVLFIVIGKYSQTLKLNM